MTAEQLQPLRAFTSNLSDWLVQEWRERHHELCGLKERMEELRQQVLQLTQSSERGS